jgi:hypothetical protein
MIEPTTDASRSPNSLRRLAWRLLIAAVCVAAALLVVFAVLIVPDQVRRVPEPRIDFGPLVGAGGNDAASAPDRKSARVRGAVDETSTSDTASIAGIDARLDPISPENWRKRCRPVADPSAIPEDLRGAAEEWNKGMDELTSEILRLAAMSDTMTWEEAEKALRDIIGRANDLEDRYEDLFPSENVYIDMDVSPITGQVARNQRRVRKFIDREWRDNWDEGYRKVGLRISTDKRQWKQAAFCCAWFCGPIAPDKKSPWWQAEVYYSRQWGLVGRGWLVYRLTAPIERDIDGVLDPFKELGETIANRFSD